MKCKQCNREYEALRSSSKFCSAKCKLAYHRGKVSVSDSVILVSVSSDCQCRNLANSKYHVNHGAWKSQGKLGEYEVNAVTLPGDNDYVGMAEVTA